MRLAEPSDSTTTPPSSAARRSIGSTSEALRHLHVAHVNSTYYGGVAELLDGLPLLMNNVGIPTGWRVIQGAPDFFSITKKMHDAVPGSIGVPNISLLATCYRFMGVNLLLAVLGLALAGAGAAIYAERRRLDRDTETLVQDLLAVSAPRSERTFHASDCGSLPAPIQRYLTHVLRDGEPFVQAVRVCQQGTFRSDGAASTWHFFSATQHVRTDPPGFVWDASIEIVPWIPVRVLDAYHQGRGLLWAKLGGILPVAHPAPGPDLDEGELMRYLAEAPLYPTALLPGRGVTWAPIDERSARATLEHRGTRASLVFHVNDRDEVAQVTGKRPFARDDGTYERRPWTGYWRNYEVRNGVRVPVDGEVAWIRPEGAVSYWRGHMNSIDIFLTLTGRREGRRW